MRKWSLVLLLGVWFASGFMTRSTQAQAEVNLASLEVQLWPEYDQPTMLVIYDFSLPPGTELPARITFRIPQEANLIAVAALQGNGLLNAPYEGPVNQSGWQVFTVTVSTQTKYHFEYYQSLDLNNNVRRFTYLWDGAYAVGEFSIRVLQPVDMLSMTTQPVLEPVAGAHGLKYYQGGPVKLEAGEQYVLRLEYEKSSETLVVPPQEIQPSGPVDVDTTGRISIGNYTPYILGGIGFVLVLGALLFYWRPGSKAAGGPRRRRAAREQDQEDAMNVYCPQCGTRAKPNDHFCRVCGTRLRKKE
jgi:hypothetical protein